MWPFSSKKRGLFPPGVPSVLRAPLPQLQKKVSPLDIRRAAGIEEWNTPTLSRPTAPIAQESLPSFFLRSAQYQQLLKLTDQVRDNILILEQTSTRLAESDYNEDKHFETLKSALRSMNKQLITIDKTFFNP